jgi:rhodanese-related sulfurtransferase
MKYLRYLFLAAFMAVSLHGAEIPRITPEVAAQKVAEGKAVLVDVREPAEWKTTGVAAPAVLLPKSDFDGPQKLWTKFLEQNRNKEIILYCHSGRRAGAVAAALATQGVRVANAGGFADWKAAGLPTRKIAP